MSRFDYDLFVIGAGSGGVRASRLAAGFGAKVAVAEESRLGGTCVNVGCVPKKLLAYAAHFREDFEDAAGFGWRAGPQAFSWPTLVANKDREISRLNGVYQRILETAGVQILRGRAAVADPHTVRVGEQEWRARHILVATGGWPVVPDIPGAELAITSNEAFHLPELPRRVIVVGGGYIAVEFASIFNGLGAETTLVYRGGRLLRNFDQDVGPFLAEEMQKKGVRILLDADIACIARNGDGLTAQLRDETTLDADAVMYATGRIPNSRGLGLEQAGVKLAENGAVIVDGHFRSSVPSILAIGDVIHRVQLTPVALAEGICVANSLFGGRQLAMDYENVPTAVFSQPNIATVGLTEAEARARHGEVDIYRTSFRPLRHTLSGRDERSLMKLVVERAGGRVVGAHMVGAEAGEIMQGIAVAVKLGATKSQFDATIGIHPTAAEEFVTLRDKVPA